MAPNEIFQYSIVSALMDGVADQGLPISTLLSHGDHGLGTFRHMVGEMIVLDGVAYQMKSDGTVASVDVSPASKVVAPFAMVTHFQPEQTTGAVLSDKADLFGLLHFLLPDAHNIYLAIRIQGVFKSITVRTVGGQSKPHEGLTEVGAHQTSKTFEEPVEGTIIGFRSPAYMQNVSVAGDHLHFISADKKRGGHLLALVSDGEVKVEVAPAYKFHLELPAHDPEFNEAELKGDAAAVAAVEG
ncbi:alpha-acetolactate decarboxylase [Cryphonectria parasitica EP155]|uniref:Alpha-acetolactate decarboxylase n=1 Tax=Cryphonectria parasitica (strain ATCC 38755 / EP155) TaxID=660469 RepID=A0A9P4XUC9_CRYP1|nr:alpha-acetolactate decarboxylase [Cryphonectria parasitica EP155]KAF3761063.1 alpha-acetolactate decarboxylase [Cryphonectria parasitica EP155]